MLSQLVLEEISLRIAVESLHITVSRALRPN